jgi:primosomal protein N' (replication factor Y)
LVQSWNPEHYAIRAVVAGDEAAFLAEELRFRQAFGYPPYTRLAALVVAHPKREEAERLARALAAAVTAQGREEVRVAGPAPAPLERLRGEWRWQLLVRAVSGSLLRRVVATAVATLGSRHVSVDIDPLDLV